MSPHYRLPLRGSVFVIVIALVIAAHVLVVRYALSHMAIGAAVGTGLVVLVILKHLSAAGLLKPLLTRLRRR